jgi:hypothetical protein
MNVNDIKKITFFKDVQFDHLVHFDEKKVWLDILKGNVTFHFCFMKVKIMTF